MAMCRENRQYQLRQTQMHSFVCRLQLCMLRSLLQMLHHQCGRRPCIRPVLAYETRVLALPTIAVVLVLPRLVLMLYRSWVLSPLWVLFL